MAHWQQQPHCGGDKEAISRFFVNTLSQLPQLLLTTGPVSVCPWEQKQMATKARVDFAQKHSTVGSASVSKCHVTKALTLAVLLFLSESLTALHGLALSTLSLKCSKQEKTHHLQQWVLVPHRSFRRPHTILQVGSLAREQNRAHLSSKCLLRVW